LGSIELWILTDIALVAWLNATPLLLSSAYLTVGEHRWFNYLYIVYRAQQVALNYSGEAVTACSCGAYLFKVTLDYCSVPENMILLLMYEAAFWAGLAERGEDYWMSIMRCSCRAL
jgi:hypothetical protein